MKTILKVKTTPILSIIFLCITFVNVNAQEISEWEILNEGVIGQVHAIDFVNENVGWIWSNQVLLKTEDGGITWDSLSTGIDEDYPDGEREFDFINETNGWGVYDQGEKSAIIKSEDGGLTWSLQYETDSVLIALYVVDDSTVYVVGEMILKTSNGGADWIDISPNLTDKSLYSVWFVNPEVGLITGYDDNTNKSMILRTFDGGIIWEEIIISLFEEINDLQFINDSKGYFLAIKDFEGDNEYFLCATTDTFNTWSIKTQSSYPIHSYFVLDDQTIFAIMDDSTSSSILKSPDGGLSWQKKHLLSNWNTNKIYFNKNNIGFTLSNFGFGGYIIMRSTDFGESWGLHTFNYPLNDVYFLDKNNGFAYGGFRLRRGRGWGDLFYTDNGGKTWYTDFNIPAILNTCFFVNDDLGFMIGSRASIIYKTTDRGNNWTIIYENNFDLTGYHIRDTDDITFINEQIGWAVGRTSWAEYDSSGAAILGTSDSGENWDLIWKFPDTGVYDYSLNSIYAVNTTTWAVGESGLIVKYTEQDQWQERTNVTDLPLNNVFFTDENHGWIAGGYLNEEDKQLLLLKTIDGGEKWNEIKDFNFQISDMYFENNLHGWAVGNDTSYIDPWTPSNSGILLETTDGGNNWTVQVDDLSAPLKAIHFKDGFGWAVGENGLVLRTEDGLTWIDEKNKIVNPKKFKLSQNYPNPFNPSTKITFTLPMPGHVTLAIYNTLGQKVATLLNTKMNAGSHDVQFDGSTLPSGIYFYRIQAGEFSQVKKMVLLR